MKFDRLLHALLPKHDHFYDYFERDVDNLLQAATTFRDLMHNSMSPEERAQKIRRIEELEHKGDEITHNIFSEVGSNFITPIDREDIHALTSALDDILDYIKGAATRLILYRVTKIPEEATKLSDLILQQVMELHTAIGLIRDFTHTERIRACLVRIHSIENDADDLFERAIAGLFDNCTDPIQLIKTKELFVSLETATDQCEDAANVIETIIVKNA
jgi:predicted phosphate transport protein (TIGR00153 family)